MIAADRDRDRDMDDTDELAHKKYQSQTIFNKLHCMGSRGTAWNTGNFIFIIKWKQYQLARDKEAAKLQ